MKSAIRPAIRPMSRLHCTFNTEKPQAITQFYTESADRSQAAADGRIGNPHIDVLVVIAEGFAKKCYTTDIRSVIQNRNAEFDGALSGQMEFFNGVIGFAIPINERSLLIDLQHL